MYLEAIQNKRVYTSIPPHLPFYVRSAEVETKGEIKLVQVPLGPNRDPKSFLKSVLEICNLSTDYVDQIKSTESKSSKNVNPMDSDAPLRYRYKDGQWSMNDQEESFDESIIFEKVRNVREETKLS